jgi:hypothetical protein
MGLPPEAEGDRVVAERNIDGLEVGRHAADRDLDAVEVRVPARVPTLARHEGGGLSDVGLGGAFAPRFMDVALYLRERSCATGYAPSSSSAKPIEGAAGVVCWGGARCSRSRGASPGASVEPRRNLRPQVATRSTWARIEAVLCNRAFVMEYASARERWRDGMAAVFPPGTYWLQRFASVPVLET